MVTQAQLMSIRGTTIARTFASAFAALAEHSKHFPGEAADIAQTIHQHLKAAFPMTSMIDTGRVTLVDPLDALLDQLSSTKTDSGDGTAQAEIERLRKECEEWSVLCNQQHALLEQRLTWPPHNNICGWCVRAAGDTQASAVEMPRFTLDEIREHSLVCVHHPLIAELAAMTAARDEALKLAGEYTAQMLAVMIDEDDQEDVAMILAVREVHLPRLRAVGGAK